MLQLRGRGRKSLVGGLSPLGEFQGWFGTLGCLEANSRGPEAREERNGSARAVQAGSYYHTEKRK